MTSGFPKTTVQESISRLTKAVNRIGDLMEEDDQEEEFLEQLFGTLIETYKGFHNNLTAIIDEADQFKKARALRELASDYQDAELRAIEKIKEINPDWVSSDEDDEESTGN